MVGVAQLVEHLNVAQEVAGSSPVTHPMYLKLLQFNNLHKIPDDENCRGFFMS